MKKITKPLIALGAIGTAVAPLAAVISCSSGDDYSDVVLIKTTWSATGPQFKAMDAIVNKYNETKGKDDKAVKLLHIEGGYGTIANLDGKDMRMNNMGNVSNLFIDYPDALGQVNIYGKMLDLSTKGVDRSKFVESFMKVNDNIEGAKGIAGKQLYYAPISTSTEMLTADLPVLKYVFAGIKAGGGTIDYTNESGILKDAHAYIDGKKTGVMGNNTTDDAVVKETWGTIKDASVFSGYTVNNDTFKSYESILEFAQKVQTAYNPDDKKGDYVLGMDAPANAAYISTFIKANYKTDGADFMYGIENNKAVYKGITDSSSNAYKNVGDALGMFKPAMDAEGLRFNGGGVFTSNDLLEHRSIFSWGSTSGYTHNYNGSMGGVEFESGSTKEVLGYNTYKLSALTPEQKAANPKAIAMGTKGAYTNPVFASDDKPATTPAHSVVVDASVKGDITTWLADDTKKDKVYMSSDVKKAVAGAKLAFIYKDKYKYFLLDPTKIDANDKGDAKTLQKEEASFTTAPSKIKSSDANDVSMLQGPSLIGIKHGGTIDGETAKFINWFFNKDSKIEYKQDDVTIADFFQRSAQYIVPITGAFDENTKSEFYDGNHIVYETFKGIEKDGSKKIAFQAPVTRYSGPLRKSVVDATLKGFWTENMKQGHKKTIANLQQNLKSLYNSIAG